MSNKFYDTLLYDIHVHVHVSIYQLNTNDKTKQKSAHLSSKTHVQLQHTTVIRIVGIIITLPVWRWYEGEICFTDVWKYWSININNEYKAHQSITNSDINRPCFAWHPYGKLGLFKTELVIELALARNTYILLKDRHFRSLIEGWVLPNSLIEAL